MGFLGSLFGSKMSTDEMIKKTSFFLSPQIQHLEENSKGYEQLLGQQGVYYILCVAEAIAKRPINNNELMALLLSSFGNDKAIEINNHYLMTIRNKNAHIDLKKQMESIAAKDVKSGMINSSNFLISHYQFAKTSLDSMFEPLAKW